MTAQNVNIPGIKISMMEIPIVGDSPLLCLRFSERAFQGIEQKQMKQAKQAKEARNPTQEYKEALYEISNGVYGFPAGAFKQAAVDSCSFIAGVTKVLARGSFFVMGDLTKIYGSQPNIRTDIGRLQGRIATPIYRAEFKEWMMKLPIRYNADAMSPEQIINLFNMAGFSIGIGQWRPEKNGNFGMFHVASSKEVSAFSHKHKIKNT